ncbi:MAG: efflux RND transporter permease subunit [Acidobacteriia bacterium]|nr:efflux RND transporter permease subunit [Terriglobia bacterium]
MTTGRIGLAGKIANLFIDSKLTPLLLLASLLLGIGAVILTPREEEPQISVPMFDVFLPMPGASSQEVEQRLATPFEKKIWEIKGVEYVYSTSQPGFAMIVVRFLVGQNMEESLVKLYDKVNGNLDLLPSGAMPPLVKARSIDDVPVLALTLWSERYDHFQLRRVADELDSQIKAIPDVSETRVIGGQRRQVRVLLDPQKMAAMNVSPLAILPMAQQANASLPAGSLATANREILLETGVFLQNAADIGRVVVGTFNGRPVYLNDVASIQDGPEEPQDYVFFGTGPAAGYKDIKVSGSSGYEFPAVTLSISKRKGANATDIANTVEKKVNSLRGYLIPSDVHVTVTRNYGETAQEKSNELLEHLLIATLSVIVLIALALGRKESLVVAVAVPVTLALTLFIYYMLGYTLNRVTLFALIFSIGILVDDAIVVVENIHRHLQYSTLPPLQAAVAAVDEVGNPTILATFTVIAAILPMAFVSGLMGPYMRPIPVGGSLAMFFSLLVAFIVSPWLAYRVLRSSGSSPGHQYVLEQTKTYRIYKKIMAPLLESSRKSMIFAGSVVVLLFISILLMYFKVVTVKMLPFDNKSEFQVIIDMPEGTTLEQTARVTKEIAAYLRTVPEVTDFESYVGTASPYNFNGLVRHYFLRRGPHVADIQVNLVNKSQRRQQSHEIAKRVRPDIDAIGARYNARIKIAEIPPGPPVLSTLVAEVYGPDYTQQIEIARQIKGIFQKTPGVVDVDWYMEDDQPKVRLVVDKEKAALNGISTAQVAQTLRIAVDGMSVGLSHLPLEKEPVEVMLRLPRDARSNLQQIKNLYIQSPSGRQVPLSEIVRFEEAVEDKSIYHKNLQRVFYVTGDVAGAQESPVYAIFNMENPIHDIKIPEGYTIDQLMTHQPFLTDKVVMKWDGEWHITYEVFRDLGIAFAAVLILIYVLVVAWFESFVVPLVIMAPIPLTLIGILPAHAIIGAFFTATSMIGFIALAGIIVRNSILLVDFINIRRREGRPLKESVIEAGSVRFRPIALTAAAVIVGGFVIILDPIFQGLAIAMMSGAFVSTALTMVAIPLGYYWMEKWNERRKRP